VDDADGRAKAQRKRTLADRKCVFGIGRTAADHRVDVHMEVGVLGEHLQLLIQHLQRLLRDIIRHDVVDGNLHVVEASFVQPLDPVGHQEVAIGNHAGDRAGLANLADDIVQLRVQQRLAAGDGNNGGAKPPEVVDAALHLFDVHGIGDVVELVAVRAGEVAAPHGHDVRHVRVRRGGDRRGDRPDLPHLAGGRDKAAAGGHLARRRCGAGGGFCGLGFDGHAGFILSRRLEAGWERAYSQGMTRTVSIEEFERSKDDFVKTADRQTVLIQRDGETVAVLTSPEQYETTREAKAQKAVEAMWAFRNHMQSVASPEELRELEKEFIGKNS